MVTVNKAWHNIGKESIQKEKSIVAVNKVVFLVDTFFSDKNGLTVFQKVLLSDIFLKFKSL